MRAARRQPVRPHGSSRRAEESSPERGHDVPVEGLVQDRGAENEQMVRYSSLADLAISANDCVMGLVASSRARR